MHRQPLIGISGSMNTEESQYFIKRDYVRSLTEAGAIPLLLAPDMTDEQARQCAEELDGLLLSGGNDVSPRCFGQEPVQGLGEVNPPAGSEWTAAGQAFSGKRKAHSGHLPRRFKMLNVALGGTLIQDLPSQHRREEGLPAMSHRQTALGQYPSHRVEVAEGSLLEQIVGQREIWVSSFHQSGGRRGGGRLRQLELRGWLPTAW
ncbi:MAG: gamma-glutamyl-gamma-aminobutyrate hydrolase family protein [Lachnospiraceae bacterium]